MLTDKQAAHQIVTLPDGGQVLIRPLDEGDHEALTAFGGVLPEDDLLYLEDDFHSPETILRLVNAHAAENWRQIVAEANGAIVGYGAARRLHGWSDHVAALILIVAEDWRRRGLGTALALAVFAAAKNLGVSKVIVEMLEEQTAGRSIFRRLGFRVEGVLHNHARDRMGRRHNLLILAYEG